MYQIGIPVGWRLIYQLGTGNKVYAAIQNGSFQRLGPRCRLVVAEGGNHGNFRFGIGLLQFGQIVGYQRFKGILCRAGIIGVAIQIH